MRLISSECTHRAQYGDGLTGGGDGDGGSNTLEAAIEPPAAAPLSPESKDTPPEPSILSPDPSKLPLPSKQSSEGTFSWADECASPDPATAKTLEAKGEAEGDTSTAAIAKYGSSTVPATAEAETEPIIGPQVEAPTAPGAAGGIGASAADGSGVGATPAANDDPFSEQTCFPAEVGTLGSLLGRGGTRVKAIRHLSGARVSVEKKDVEPHRTSRIVSAHWGSVFIKFIK